MLTDEGSQSPERQFAEDVGLVGEQMGMPRMVARLLGWLLICDPPAQSSADLARALGVSRASISISTRLLEATGLIRRTAGPTSRGRSFELDPDVFARLPAAERFGTLRRLFDRGIGIVGSEADPRAARLRVARDFYAYVEREIPLLIERYRAGGASGRPDDGQGRPCKGARTKKKSKGSSR